MKTWSLVLNKITCQIQWISCQQNTGRGHAGKKFQALDQVLKQINKDHIKMVLGIQFDMSAGLTQYLRINYNAGQKQRHGQG